jgi:hypothetical protein
MLYPPKAHSEAGAENRTLPGADPWLLAEPHLTAVDLHSRLKMRAPETFGQKQLRTVRRTVKAGGEAAGRLIGGAELAIPIDADSFVPAETKLSGLPVSPCRQK